jgi:hypothetical protein
VTSKETHRFDCLHCSSRQILYVLTAVCSLDLGAYRCGSWGGPLVAAVYLPVINRTQPLPPLAAEDAWMDALQLQWDEEEAAAAPDMGRARAASVDAASTAEDLAAAGALLAARQAIQAVFDKYAALTAK